MEQPDKVAIGRRVAEIRKLLGSVMEPLGFTPWARLIQERTGYEISPQSLRRYEEGRRMPDMEAVAAIVATDPKRRSPAWLAGWGADTSEARTVKLWGGDVPVARPTTKRKRRGA
jgi:transcriptional regulator with XRE-family HTH domain